MVSIIRIRIFKKKKKATDVLDLEKNMIWRNINQI